MRIIVFSDTHGNFAAMTKIFKRNKDASIFIFLGDGESDLSKIRIQYGDKKILSVAGNCDNGSKSPESAVCPLYTGNKIYFTHGHKIDVSGCADDVYNAAKQAGADIALFGHTHCRFVQNRDGVLMLNPGSASIPRDGKPACYAWLDVTTQGIAYNHVDL